jgi:hypothetical protein
MGFIDRDQLEKRGREFAKTNYGKYILRVPQREEY